MNALVNEFIIKLKKRKIEGSKATAKLTAEVLRSCISQQRLPQTNQADALIDAIRGIGEKLIAANPVGISFCFSFYPFRSTSVIIIVFLHFRLFNCFVVVTIPFLVMLSLVFCTGLFTSLFSFFQNAFTCAEDLLETTSLPSKAGVTSAYTLPSSDSSCGIALELAVGNIVRRVLNIIREEDVSLTAAAIGGLCLSAGSDDEDDFKQDDHQGLSAAAVAAAARNTLRPPSLQTLLEDIPQSTAVPRTSSSGGDSEGKSKSADKNSTSRKLKHNVIEAVNELIQDIATCHEQIAEQAVEHIHHNEVILTLGNSRTVMEFLCAAKEKKRSFRVFVAEGAPRYQGHALAKELVARGLQTTVITDSAVFAIISRVNMVVVGAHTVMANGGVIAPVGMNMVALAAQRHAVPFVVLAGTHKLCPLYPHNPEVLLNELKSPAELLDFGEFSDCLDFGSSSGSPLLHVVNPAFDYVPPNLVSLFITDTGGHNASFMYRLIADYYSADDIVVKQKSIS